MLAKDRQVPYRRANAIRVVQVAVNADVIPSGIPSFQPISLAESQPIGLVDHRVLIQIAKMVPTDFGKGNRISPAIRAAHRHRIVWVSPRSAGEVNSHNRSVTRVRRRFRLQRE